MSRERRMAAAIVAATRALGESLGGKEWGPISNRHIDGVVNAFDWPTYDATLTTLFMAELGQAASYAARAEAVRLERQVGLRKAANPKIRWALDATDPRMQAWAQRHAAALVTSISSTTRQAIRALVVESFNGTYTAVDLARQLRTLVGPLPRDVAAIARAQAANIQTLMESGVPYHMAAERADALARRMAEKAVRRRAMTISRTEIIRASNQGTIEGWRQADDLGLISDTARKQWIAFDPCDICQDLDGTEVPWQDDFDGGIDAPPAHPNCKCACVMVANEDASNPLNPVEG